MSRQPAGSSEEPLFCDRCVTVLRLGEGDLYLVKIEAMADPTPPVFSDEDLRRDHQAEIQRLFTQAQDSSAQEMLDQVYRRLTLYLCGSCYRQWIENPTG